MNTDETHGGLARRVHRLLEHADEARRARAERSVAAASSTITPKRRRSTVSVSAP